MPRDRHDALLRAALERTPLPIDAARRDALEQTLADSVAARGDRRVAPPRRWTRWLLGGGLALAVTAGACVLPSDYDAAVGHRLAIILEGDDVEVDPHALVDFITEQHHPDELRMAVAKQRLADAQGHAQTLTRIELDAVGDDLEPQQLWNELVAAFPELEGARLEDQELRGRIHGTLGGRLSHDWLDITLDRHGVESAKVQIIEQLRAEGLSQAVVDSAQIEILDHDDGQGRVRREVRVQLEDEQHVTGP
ncbi:MAG: hypothetical protein K1X88_01840 [Nannocystaceae bacterium]|nr:hypothetical protein [Nannocystaceae bacterium]